MASSPGTPFHLTGDGIETISAFQSAYYLEVACFTLLVYDLLTTFGEEVCNVLSLVDTFPNMFASQVEYFWSGPWSVSRVLFFLVLQFLSEVSLHLTKGL